jgi:hypothetical protein
MSLCDKAALDTHLASSSHMKPHAAALREVLIEMEPFQDEVMAKSKAERTKKKSNKAALEAGHAVDGGATLSSDDGSSNDSGVKDGTHLVVEFILSPRGWPMVEYIYICMSRRRI